MSRLRGSLSFTHYFSIAILIAVAAICCVAYLIHWDLGYSSDTAMVSLMAQEILQEGDRPIFVWSVGYQGVFLEAYLSALYMKIFGVAPWVSSLAPMTYYFIFLSLFFTFTLRAFDPSVASIATLFLLLGSPYQYGLMLRTTPNFPEICMLGMIAFLIYPKVLEKKSVAWSAALGFIMGFAIYTYVLSVFFFFSIAAHLLLRERQAIRRGDIDRPRAIDILFPHIPVRYRPLKVALLITLFILILNFGLGFGLFLLEKGEVVLLGKSVRFNPILMMTDSLKIWGAISTLRYIYDRTASHSNARNQWLAWATGYAIGFSPSLYYRWVLGGGVLKGAAIGGSGEELVKRMSLLLNGHGLYYNLFPLQMTQVITILILVSLLGWFYFSHRTNRTPQLLPLLLLPGVAISGFLLSSATLDESSARYLLPILVPYSIAIGWSLVSLYRQGVKRSSKTLITCVVCAGTLVLGNNAHGLYKNLKFESNPMWFTSIVDALDQEGLTHGYGNYWFSYSITFLTEKRILIDPVQSRYNTEYRKKIAGQHRIALIDTPVSVFFGKEGQTYSIDNHTYKIVKELHPQPHFSLRIAELVQ